MTGRINRPGLLVCNRVYAPPLGVKQVFIFKFIFQKNLFGRSEDWKRGRLEGEQLSIPSRECGQDTS